MRKVLEGELARFSMADLLGFVGQSGLTAVLALERAEQESKLFFRDGRPVFAVSTHEDLRLGALLARGGKVGAAAVERAVHKCRAAGWRLGQALLADGTLTEDELAAALKVQVSEVVYDAFTWREGCFSLYDRVPPPVTAITLTVELQTLVMEGVRRHPDPARAEALAGLLDQGVETLANPERVKHKLALTPEEWQVFFLADGRRTLREICRLAAGDEAATLVVVQRLLDGRLLGLTGEQGGATIPEPIAAADEGEEEPGTQVAGAVALPSRVAVEFASGVRSRAPQDDSGQVVDPQAVRYLADAQRLTISRLVLMQDGAETSCPLMRDAYTLGRHRNNDIVIGDAKVSSFHARIDRTAEGFVLVDLNSRNGTFVNGQSTKRSVLRTGDELRLGTTRLVYKVDYTSAM